MITLHELASEGEIITRFINSTHDLLGIRGSYFLYESIDPKYPLGRFIYDSGQFISEFVMKEGNAYGREHIAKGFRSDKTLLTGEHIHHLWQMADNQFKLLLFDTDFGRTPFMMPGLTKAIHRGFLTCPPKWDAGSYIYPPIDDKEKHQLLDCLQTIATGVRTEDVLRETRASMYGNLIEKSSVPPERGYWKPSISRVWEPISSR